MSDKLLVKYVKGGKVVKMPARYASPLIKMGHLVPVELEKEEPAKPVKVKKEKVVKADDEQE